jgi:hypothetical protein
MGWRPPQNITRATGRVKRRARRRAARASRVLCWYPTMDQVEAMLARRGLAVSKAGRAGECLLPEPPCLDGYYARLTRYSFRLLLRDVIKRRERITARALARYASEDSAAGDIAYLASVGLLAREGGLAPPGDAWRLARPVPGFGPTLEWYVAEVLRRELLAPVLTDVRLGPPGPGGDYDVLAGLDGALLYVEAKSSPPKQVYAPEVAAFLERVAVLAPEIAVFLVDTRLGMGEKIVPMFEEELARRPGHAVIARLQRGIFHVRSRVFVANSEPGIAANLAAILRAYHAARSPLP